MWKDITDQEQMPIPMITTVTVGQATVMGMDIMTLITQGAIQVIGILHHGLITTTITDTIITTVTNVG